MHNEQNKPIERKSLREQVCENIADAARNRFTPTKKLTFNELLEKFGTNEGGFHIPSTIVNRK